MRHLLPTALLFVACSDDSAARPDPTSDSDTTSSAEAASAASSTASASSASASASTASAASATSTGVGGANEGGGNEGGSGGGNMQALGYENGSRLRAKVHVGADGSRQFSVWHDTMLDKDCYFQRASDGVIRCLPVTSADTAQASANYYFYDAACTLPAAVGYCAAPSYVVEASAGFCAADNEWTVRQLGPQQPTLYLKVGANCNVGTVQPGGHVYAIGAELPPSTFVEATTVIE